MNPERNAPKRPHAGHLHVVRRFAVAILLASCVISPASASGDRFPGRGLSVAPLDLSRAPSHEELMAAGQLGGPLHPTRPHDGSERDDEIALSFGRAIQEWNRHNYPQAARQFDAHLAQYPDSPWAAEADLHIGCDSYYRGRHGEAERRFRSVMDRVKGRSDEGARRLRNKARVRLANLRVRQGDLAGAKGYLRDVIAERLPSREVTYASHWIQRLSRMSAQPRAAADCGPRALAHLFRKAGLAAEGERVASAVPASEKGMTLKELADLAAANGLPVRGLDISVEDLGRLPLPLIAHIPGHGGESSGHYWVVEKAGEEGVDLYDPQERTRFRQTREELASEWSGRVLVASVSPALAGARTGGSCKASAGPKKPSSYLPGLGEAGCSQGILLGDAGMSETAGGCCGVPRPEDGLGCPDGKCKQGPSTGPGGPPAGSPRWTVNMVNMNLFLQDIPLWYSPAIGPAVALELSYNSQSAIAYNEPFGRKWQFNYATTLTVDTAGTVTVFMPDGRRDVYEPDGAGGYVYPYKVYNTLVRLGDNHFELRFPEGGSYEYAIPAGTFSLQPFLVAVRDRHGLALRFEYDASGRLARILDAQGGVTTLVYAPEGLLTQVSDPFGRTAFFTYDVNGNLTRITDMGGYWAQFSYDSNSYLTSLDTAAGRWLFRVEPADGIENDFNAYPAPGGTMWEDYRVTVTNPLGGRDEYYYNGYSSYSWYVAPRNYVDYVDNTTNNFSDNVAKTTYEYSAIFRNGTYVSGEVGGVISDSGLVSMLYDNNANIILENRMGAPEVAYTYNDNGSVTSVSDVFGTKTFTYSANGVDPVRIDGPAGSVELTYNASRDVTSVTDRMGATTTYAYNAYGQLVSTSDPLGTVTAYAYDSSQRVHEVSKGGSRLASFTYDAVGRVRTYMDAAGKVFTYDYNALDDLTRTTYPDGKFATIAYSPLGPHLVERVTDRGGRTVSRAYDALLRTTSVTDAAATTGFAYDGNNNLVGITDPKGNATAFEWDNTDLIVRKTYPDGSTVGYNRNPLFGLVSRTNARGIETRYVYDFETYQLTSIEPQDGGATPRVSYSYDSLGRVAGAEATGADAVARATLYSYDNNSRITSVDGPLSDDTVSVAYDALGRVTGLSAAKGRAVAYTYDLLGRLTEVRAGGDVWTYAYAGATPRVASLTRPNGVVTAYEYDAMSRMTRVTNRTGAGAVIDEYAYAYDNADRVASVTATPAAALPPLPSEETAFSVNALNQAVSSSAPARTYEYDADGNQTRGYVPTGESFQATYDATNRLSSIQYTDNVGAIRRAEFGYGPTGFLARQVDFLNGAPTGESRNVRFAGLTLQVRDSMDNVVREYIWAPGNPGGIGSLLSERQGGVDTYFHYDGIGNVTSMTDGTQSVVGAYAYDPFGVPLLASGSRAQQDIRYMTKAYSGRWGISDYGYRFYSPAMGRWLTRDPLGEMAGTHLYEFVNGNPIQRIDPYGLEGEFGQWMTTYVGGPLEWIRGQVRDAFGGKSESDSAADAVTDAVVDEAVDTAMDQTEPTGRGWKIYKKVKGWFDKAKKVAGLCEKVKQNIEDPDPISGLRLMGNMAEAGGMANPDIPLTDSVAEGFESMADNLEKSETFTGREQYIMNMVNQGNRAPGGQTP